MQPSVEFGCAVITEHFAQRIAPFGVWRSEGEPKMKLQRAIPIHAYHFDIASLMWVSQCCMVLACEWLSQVAREMPTCSWQPNTRLRWSIMAFLYGASIGRLLRVSRTQTREADRKLFTSSRSSARMPFLIIRATTSTWFHKHSMF